MKTNKVLSIIFAICLLCSVSASAYAKSYPSNAEEAADVTFSVTFESDGKTMTNTFQKGLTDISVRNELEDRVSNLQPGDDVTFTINFFNRYSKSTNWYMTSKIIDSLEEGNAKDGAYSYYLRYENSTDSSKNKDIYVSDTIGGLNSNGLEDVNSAIKEDYARSGEKYFYLDNLGTNGSGQVKLTVALDGETQGNTYQDRLADLKMNFAVEVVNNPTSPNTSTNAPKTGDDNNMLPYYIAMIISGLLFLYFALDAYTDKLYKKGKG